MNKMKLYTIIGAGLFALTSTTLLACSEIEDGSNDMSSWPEVKDYVTTLEHPCMLHTETDFEFVNAFDHLSRGGNSLSQSNYKASPVKLLARLDQNNWAGKYPNDWNNYTKLMKDAAAAYQLALRWKLSETDGAQYADAAVAILNDWAKTCTGFIVNDKGEFIDPNEFLQRRLCVLIQDGRRLISLSLRHGLQMSFILISQNSCLRTMEMNVRFIIGSIGIYLR